MGGKGKKEKFSLTFSTGITGVILVFIVSLSILLSEELPFRLEALWCKFAQVMCPVDIDKDGVDEIFMILGDRILSLVDQNFTFYCQYPDSLNWKGVKVFDVKFLALFDERANDIVIPYRVRDSLFLDIFSVRDTSGFKRERNMYIAFGADRKPPPGWDGSVNDIVLNEGAGGRSMLVAVNTGYDLKPRGIFSIDLDGKKNWFFEIAPHISSVSVADIDRDGFNEVLISTNSVCNLNRVENTDDCHSYLFLITDRGKLLWCKEIGTVFSKTYAQLSDLDGDREYEIVLLEQRGRGSGPDARDLDEKFPSSCLMILGPESGDVLRIVSPGENLRSFILADINNDLRSEILVGTVEGNLKVYDSSLELMDECRYSSWVDLKEAVDLNGDGYKEIVALCGGKDIVIFDHNLRLAAIHPVEPKVNRVYVVSSRRKARLLVGNSIPETDGSYYQLLEIKRNVIIPSSLESNKGFLLFLIVGIICVLGGMFLYVGLRNKTSRLLVRISARDSGVIELSRKGKILYMNSKLRDLFRLEREVIGLDYMALSGGECLDRIVELIGSTVDDGMEGEKIITCRGEDNGTRYIRVRASKVGSRIILYIKDVTSETIGKHALSWLPAAQKLGHAIKNRLNMISLPLRRLRKICEEMGAANFQRHLDFIEEEIKNLRKLSINFVKMVSLDLPNVGPVCLNTLLKRLVRELETGLPSGVEIECFFDNDLPPVPGDEEQLKEAFSNIIQNAVQAIGEEGLIQIETVLSDQVPDSFGKEIAKCARVEIRDTGVGISKEDMDRVFKPFYSTRPDGSGLGLYITKQVIEMHKGTIEINSEEGQMTTVVVHLPICQGKVKNGMQFPASS